MATINWDEYKQYKQEHLNPKGLDNFGLLIGFMRSYYNITDAHRLFGWLSDDPLSSAMMQKRAISDGDSLERYIETLR